VKPLSEALLYAFVDADYLQGRSPVDLAHALCAGGADLIQLRAKRWPLEEIERTARALRQETRRWEVGLVINDHPSIAASAEADFCHLGQEDFFDSGHARVSEIETGGAGIGLSSHAPAQAERAVRAGAAYVAVGPVFATPTKPDAPPVGLEYVRWAAGNLSIPWFAIGGIHAGNLDAVLEAGARRVCLVSALLTPSRVTETCQAFKTRLRSAFSKT
jgi:thiamine-phosphate pyrophosphorylase